MKKIRFVAIVTLCCILLLVVHTHEQNVNIDSVDTPKSDAVEESFSKLQHNTEKEALQYNSLKDKIICVDAGHGVTALHGNEPIAPGSSEMKSAHVSGTMGNTMTEEQVNLFVALKLEQRLVESGAKVVMTRTKSECDLSNIDRARLANDAGADLTIRIHADGNDNSEIHGISILIPSGKYISNSDMLEKSKKAGEFILNGAVNATDAVNRGVVERPDMTGFNWSTVPVVLIEMGFMTNPEEDILLSSDEYQNKMTDGIMDGLKNYFDELREGSL